MLVFAHSVLLHAAEAPKVPVEELIREGNRLVLQEGQYLDATRVYKQAFEDYQSPDAALNLAIVYDHYLHFKRKAVIYYREFLRLAPEHPYKERVLQQIEGVGKNKPEPIQDSSKALPHIMAASENDHYAREGNQSLKDMEYTLAINNYQRAVVVNNSAVACYNLALVYDFDLKFYTRAIYYYQKYLALDPEAKASGEVAKRIESAREALMQSMKVAPKSHIPLLGPK